MLGHNTLSVVDLADDDANAAVAILAAMDLRRSAPAAIQQNARRRHASCRWTCLLADDPREHLDAQRGVPTCE